MVGLGSLFCTDLLGLVGSSSRSHSRSRRAAAAPAAELSKGLAGRGFARGRSGPSLLFGFVESFGWNGGLDGLIGAVRRRAPCEGEAAWRLPLLSLKKNRAAARGNGWPRRLMAQHSVRVIRADGDGELRAVLRASSCCLSSCLRLATTGVLLALGAGARASTASGCRAVAALALLPAKRARQLHAWRVLVPCL